MNTNTLFLYDEAVRQEGYVGVCGVDEAGRGPLAGAVYAAAVLFPAGLSIEGINDSKQLSAKKRDALFDEIRASALCFGIGQADVGEIDRLNILNATFLAMRRAVEALRVAPDIVLVDGNACKGLSIAHRCIVKGDGLSQSIAAASILAKVSRDRAMEALAEIYPHYEFEKHKGYPTKRHYELLEQYGPSPVHRETFLKKFRAR